MYCFVHGNIKTDINIMQRLQEIVLVVLGPSTTESLILIARNNFTIFEIRLYLQYNEHTTLLVFINLVNKRSELQKNTLNNNKKNTEEN